MAPKQDRLPFPAAHVPIVDLFSISMPKNYSLTLGHIERVREMKREMKAKSDGEIVRRAIDLLWEVEHHS